MKAFNVAVPMIDLFDRDALRRVHPRLFQDVMGGDLIIWADPDKLKVFLKTAGAQIDPSTLSLQIQQPGHTRRAYPGDTGFAVKAHTRKLVTGYSIEGTSATPGWNFSLRKGVLVAERWMFDEVHQFTCLGTQSQLITLVEDQRKVPLSLVGKTGKRYNFLTTAPT